MQTHDSPFAPKLVSIVRGGYGLDAFRHDAIAGLTVAIVALPLSMAIAIASGAGPERGLYTAIVGGFLISALGGSRFQVGGPAGAFIVLVAATVDRHGFDGLLLATIIAGLMMLAIGLFRLGSMIKFIPQPVTIGFTAGIAVIIFASQIKDLLGMTLPGKEPGPFVSKLAALWQAIGSANGAAIGLSMGTVALILLIRRYRPNWPVLLIAVVLGAALTTIFGLPVETIGSRFGSVPSTLPAPALPPVSLAKIEAVLPDAIAIALLGSIESLLSAVVADGMSGRRHRSNTELVAQGVANICSALFGGLCATGTIARTATNVRAGARSPVAGMMHSAYLLVFMLVAANAMTLIPLAVLAGILALVAWNMAERHAILALAQGERGDFLVFAATFLLTVFRDLTEGILVGVVLGALLFSAKMARLVEIGQGEGELAEDQKRVAFDTSGDVLIYRISGPLFFGSTPRFGDMIARLGLSPRAIILDLSNVPLIDTTGVQAIAMLQRAARQVRSHLIISGAQRDVLRALVRGGLGRERVSYARSLDAARRRAGIAATA